MIPSRRQQFNENWSSQKYGRFLQLLADRSGGPALFRVSETPCFFPSELIDRMARYGSEMMHQLLSNPDYLSAADDAIPAEYRVPNEAPYPMFVQADFGIDAHGDPKLVEIQGFPTLYFYQPVMAQAYCDAYELDEDLALLPAGLTLNKYHALLRQAIVGTHDSENVVLTEIDPAGQKTRNDFILTERVLGVRTVDIRDLVEENNRLFYRRGSQLVPIHRIYNRAIVDEISRRDVQLPFRWTDDLQVEWAGHPNWFFRLSKFSLPYLQHPAVPHTRFLDQIEVVDDPERYVLKPLYSFAGAGVVVGPTHQQLAAIPDELRSGYILQERVDFAPVIKTPHGATKVEVRIMFLWLDEMRPVNTIVRTGRGAQMGVDHNKGAEWVGASAALID